MADPANYTLHAHSLSQTHPILNSAEGINIQPIHTLDPTLDEILQEPMLDHKKADLLENINVFLEDSLGVSQVLVLQCRYVCWNLLHPLEELSCTNDEVYPPS